MPKEYLVNTEVGAQILASDNPPFDRLQMSEQPRDALHRSPHQVQACGGDHDPEVPRDAHGFALGCCGSRGRLDDFLRLDLGATARAGAIGHERIRGAPLFAGFTPGHGSDPQTRLMASTATSSSTGPWAKLRAASSRPLHSTSGATVGSRRMCVAMRSSPNNSSPRRASARPSV